MNEYTKINTIWKRDEKGRIIEGEYSCPEFAYLADNQWEWTEKVDGTNVRVFWDHGRVEFGGRTDNAQMPAKLVSALRAMFGENLADVFPDTDAILYGEGYGAGIQKGGGNYRPDQSFVLFDVRVGDIWLRRSDVEDIAQKLGIDIVPIIFCGPLSAACDAVQDPRPRSAWGGFRPEGYVGRPPYELSDRRGNRIITKIKVRDYAA